MWDMELEPRSWYPCIVGKICRKTLRLILCENRPVFPALGSSPIHWWLVSWVFPINLWCLFFVSLVLKPGKALDWNPRRKCPQRPSWRHPFRRRRLVCLPFQTDQESSPMGVNRFWWTWLWADAIKRWAHSVKFCVRWVSDPQRRGVKTSNIPKKNQHLSTSINMPLEHTGTLALEFLPGFFFHHQALQSHFGSCGAWALAGSRVCW